MSAHMHVLDHTFIISMLSLSNCCAIFPPSRSMISLKRAVEINHWLFSPVVDCELNVNARVCKHDVTHFISFVPGCYCFILSAEALHMQFTAKYVFWSNNILCESHEMSFVHPKHAFMPCWIAVEYVARVLHYSASSL